MVRRGRRMTPESEDLLASCSSKSRADVVRAPVTPNDGDEDVCMVSYRAGGLVQSNRGRGSRKYTSEYHADIGYYPDPESGLSPHWGKPGTQTHCGSLLARALQ